MESPEICGEVYTAATNTSAIQQRLLANGFFLCRSAKRTRLYGGVIGQKMLVQNLDFVVTKIFLGEVRSLLQHHDAEAIGREFFRQNAPRRPEPTITKSTSSEVLYVTLVGVIFSPLPLWWPLAIRGSDCRSTQTVEKKCEQDHDR